MAATLVLQDATGTVSGANAYADYDAFTDWLENRGITTTETASAVDPLLIQACDYIDRRFQFNGFKKATGQTTEFPRYGESDVELNGKIVVASILYAKILLDGGSLWLTDKEIDERQLKSLDTSVDVLSDKKEWFAPLGDNKTHPEADSYVVACGWLSNMGRYPIRA